MSRSGRRGSALAAAVIALAVGVALAVTVADVAREETALAARRIAAAEALAAVDACLAGVLAAVPPGWDFAALLAGGDGVAGTADDGDVPAPAGCTARAALPPGAADPPRVRLTVDAERGGGRRAVTAVAGLDPVPGLPVLLWLPSLPTPGTFGGAVLLDGADASTAADDWAALAAPDTPAALDAWLTGEPAVRASPRTRPPRTATPPPLPALATRLRAGAPVGPHVLGPLGDEPAPAPILADGGLVVTGARAGAGILFVDGPLDIHGTFDFTGLVIASGGIRIVEGATLSVAGALWIGPSPTPLVVDGVLAVRQDRPAIEAADGLQRLPRPPRLLGLRDLG
jgi:hypothetical protein